MNDKIFDRINDEWTDTTVDDFKGWLKSHRETDMVAKVVHDNLDSLEEKWKQEKFDSYPDWW
jgi:hypothetical protein